VFTEEDWTALDGPAHVVTPYFKSKTLAERAAWEYVRGLPAGDAFELATIIPGFIQGPVLGGTSCASAEPVSRLLGREMPMVPDIWFPSVDVRDVARAHILAMTNPAAAGQRFLVVGGNLHLRTGMAAVLAREFDPQGYNVPLTSAPSFLIRLAALFDGGLSTVTGMLGIKTEFDASKATRVLGLTYTPVETSVVDMAYSLVAGGRIADKTRGRALTSAPRLFPINTTGIALPGVVFTGGVSVGAATHGAGAGAGVAAGGAGAPSSA